MSELIHSSLVNVLKLIESDLDKDKILKDPIYRVAKMAIGKSGLGRDMMPVKEIKLSLTEETYLRQINNPKGMRYKLLDPVIRTLRACNFVEIGTAYTGVHWGSGIKEEKIDPFHVPMRVTELGMSYLDLIENKN